MGKTTAKKGAAAELNPRQSRFIEEFLLEPNSTQAAIKAGYSKKGANRTGPRLLSDSRISSAIEQRQAQRAERVQVDADYVMRRLIEIDQLDVIDIVDDAGNLLPIREWPKSWRQSITGLDLHEIQSGDVMTVIRKIKWPDKIKNLDLIGKHRDIMAWREQRDMISSDGSMTPSRITRVVIDEAEAADE